MDTPSPRAVDTRLTIKSRFSGLYSLVEQVDGRFDQYHFENAKGNLYKEVWPLKHNDTATSEDVYLYALKTNEDENPSVAIINNFGKQIAKVNSLEERRNLVKQYMNIDQILSNIAVDRTIRHDDPFDWYCRNIDCENHNY